MIMLYATGRRTTTHGGQWNTTTTIIILNIRDTPQFSQHNSDLAHQYEANHQSEQCLNNGAAVQV